MSEPTLTHILTAALAECRRDLARIDAITAASGDPAVVAHQPDDGMLVRRVRDLAAAAQEQAAEVERLRAAFDGIPKRCRWIQHDGWCGTTDCPCRVAEEALGRKP
jgi:hypothetical protein